MAFQNPSVAQFKAQFTRDFPFDPTPMTPDPTKYVEDSDITYAFQFVNATIPQELFPDQATYTVGYNLLAAHNLVMNLRSSSQGINGQFNWLQNTKSVGAVSESFTIPDRISSHPLLSLLTKTNYGTLYLQLVLPYLSGAMFTACMPARAL